MGFDPHGQPVNNWNPWVNSNWLTAVLLLETDRKSRCAAVDKILHSLDYFIGIYTEDGGCDEGPGYWGRAAASLFDCLDQLFSASQGAIDVFQEEKIKNMGRFIYRAHIGGNYYVNYADASAINHPTPSLVYRYGKAIEDTLMMEFGAWLARQNGYTHAARDSMSRELPRLFMSTEMEKYPPQQPLPHRVYFDGIQVMVTREHPGDISGFFLSAKGGHNAESHNHNDVGNFIVYRDGNPLIVDAGVETYTRKTFSPQRYEIWTMQSAFHTLLPILDGVQQQEGVVYTARDVGYREDDEEVQFTLDIAGAYPPASGLQSLQRTFTFKQDAGISITDIVNMASPVEVVLLGLLTPCQVHFDLPGIISFARTVFAETRISGEGYLIYDPDQFTTIVESIEIHDERLGMVWGNYLNRIIFTWKSPSANATWNWRIVKDLPM